jgi:hypothetical protein
MQFTYGTQLMQLHMVPAQDPVAAPVHPSYLCYTFCNASTSTRFAMKKHKRKTLQQESLPQQQQQQPQQQQQLPLQQPPALQLQQEQQQQQAQADCEVVVQPLTQQQEQKQRKQRCRTAILYHQTSPEIARAILATGQMKPGSKGYGGAGIYFAAAPEITATKATKKGVILECEVDLGKVKEICCSGDWSSRVWHWLYDYDSIKITSISDGTEWVVFDSSRIKAVRLWRPGVSAEQVALLLLLLAGNAAAVLQCALLAVAQVLQQMHGRMPGCGRPSLRSLGKC